MMKPEYRHLTIYMKCFQHLRLSHLDINYNQGKRLPKMTLVVGQSHSNLGISFLINEYLELIVEQCTKYMVLNIISLSIISPCASTLKKLL